ncbi:GGDEF domain-containing phosphodiesterase [Sphaerotilus sp.]|uniref:putative bifunctional diguanylate cyclase/phosphodiesterase n=1 Tax=Sphaerotilus sp. TaxID=2093942 RepID=UPI00286D9C73|nr:GGDEF domain-containing phosphodiesterase [Sphaerotilus sp.]
MVSSSLPPARGPAAYRAAPPLLDAARRDDGDATPLRVLLQVDHPWRATLASALLDHGLQPVLPSDDGQAPADVVVREFSSRLAPGSARRPASAASQPMIAWLNLRPGDDASALRHRALDAGAVSLVQASHHPDELVRVTAHLGRLRPDHAAAGGPMLPTLHAALARVLQQASTRTDLGALVLLDLQRFDEVVLTLGPSLRDPLLRAIEHRLQMALIAIRARHAGRLRAQLTRHEEGLAVIASPLLRSADAQALACELLQRLDDPVDVGDHRIVVGGHAGVAVFPHDGHQPEVLVRHATLALHEARRQGRNGCVVYSPVLGRGAMRRLQLEGALRRALAQSAFTLQFQPQADLHTGALTGAEVLLRWHDRDLGRVEPTEFIALAEDTGLITRIGAWVLQHTCQQIRQWRDQGLDVPRIAVNVSRLEVVQPGFVAGVLQALVDHGLPGGTLTLELTEPALMHDPERLGERLQALRAAGVRIAVDDFGSGYSSLARLSQLPLDELKIDRVFLATLEGNGAKVAAAVIGMGHSLGLRVLAEGVEREDQLDFLRRHGCDEFQGHLLSHPLDAATMGQVLSHARIQHRLVMDTFSPAPAPAPPTRMPPFPSLPTLPMQETETAGGRDR